MNKKLSENELFKSLVKEIYAELTKQNLNEQTMGAMDPYVGAVDTTKPKSDSTPALVATATYRPSSTTGYTRTHNDILSKALTGFKLTCNKRFTGNKTVKWTENIPTQKLLKYWASRNFGVCIKDNNSLADTYVVKIYNEYNVVADLLTFNQEDVYSAVYGEKYYYKLAGAQIQILDSSYKKYGSILAGGNKIFYKIDPAIKKEYYATVKTKDTEQDALTKTLIHTGLDIAGFVDVFGIGTVADAINAVLYFKEGENFLAVLSLLSAVPIWGSILLYPLKKLAKRVFGRGAKKVSQELATLIDEINTIGIENIEPKKLKRVFELLEKDGVLTFDELKVLHEGFIALENWCKKNSNSELTIGEFSKLRKAIAKIQQIAAKAAKGSQSALDTYVNKKWQQVLARTDNGNLSNLLKNTDNVDEFVETAQKTASDAMAVSSTATGTISRALGAGIDAATGIPSSGKAVVKTLSKTGSVAKQAAIKAMALPGRLHQKILQAMMIQFKKKLANDPKMILMAGESVMQGPNFVNKFKNAIIKVVGQEPYEYYMKKAFPNPTSGTDADTVFDLFCTRNSAGQVKEIFTLSDKIAQWKIFTEKILHENAGYITKQEYYEIIDNLGDEIIAMKSPVWTLFKHDFFRSLKSIFMVNFKSMGTFVDSMSKTSFEIARQYGWKKSLGQVFNFAPTKWIDIFYKEVRDGFYAAYHESNENDVHGILFTLIVAACNELELGWAKGLYDTLYVPRVEKNKRDLQNYTGTKSNTTYYPTDPNKVYDKNKKSGGMRSKNPQTTAEF